MKPQLTREKLVIVDPVCPGRPATSDEFNDEIQEIIYTIFPETAQSEIVFVTGYSKFVKLTKKASGAYVNVDLTFAYGN